MSPLTERLWEMALPITAEDARMISEAATRIEALETMLRALIDATHPTADAATRERVRAKALKMLESP